MLQYMMMRLERLRETSPHTRLRHRRHAGLKGNRSNPATRILTGDRTGTAYARRVVVGLGLCPRENHTANHEQHGQRHRCSFHGCLH
jgi:hypothetical protein